MPCISKDEGLQTTEIYCHNGDPLHQTLPCQAGYGSCAVTEPKSCAEGGGSTNGRKIGYYQSWNMRNRKCNKVSPTQLNTTGYTHIFYSFASIDPTAYTIRAAHPDDEAMMKEFTGLKSGTLKTWIAIGGFDFSDPGQDTHTTWSDVCLTKANRAALLARSRLIWINMGFRASISIGSTQVPQNVRGCPPGGLPWTGVPDVTHQNQRVTNFKELNGLQHGKANLRRWCQDSDKSVTTDMAWAEPTMLLLIGSVST